jgi:6-phosphofructokinase 2
MTTVYTLTMNPSIDISTSVPRVVADQKLRCERPRVDPGGGGLNVARVIHRLGGRCTALYAAGGHSGRLLQELLRAEGIDHRALEIDGSTRQDVTVTDRGDGRQYRFVMPGPLLVEAEWQRGLDRLLQASPVPDYIVASGSLPQGVPTDFYARLARSARQVKARVVLDTSGEALRAAAREPVYLLKPNRREVEELIGRPPADEGDLSREVEKFVRGGGAEAVVVSLGAQGALLVTRDGAERLSAPEVPVESRIGAGDSMVGGIVLALARGDSMRDAVLLGLAAGSAAVMTPGTELCRPTDVERLLAALRTRPAAAPPPAPPVLEGGCHVA